LATAKTPDLEVILHGVPVGESLYGAKILSIIRNRGGRLPEIIVDDTSQNILPSNQTFCTPLRARHRKVLADAVVRA